MDPEIKSEGNGQVPPVAPPVGNGNGQVPPANIPPAAVVDPSILAAELAEARRESAKERTDKKKLEDRLAAIERDQLSEQERTKADLTTAQAELAKEREAREATQLENVLLRHAATHNLRADAHDAALLLLDRSLLDWADGKPTPASVTKALTELVKKHPYLVAAAPVTAPAPGPSGFAPQGTGTTGHDPGAAAYTQRISGSW